MICYTEILTLEGGKRPVLFPARNPFHIVFILGNPLYRSVEFRYALQSFALYQKIKQSGGRWNETCCEDHKVKLINNNETVIEHCVYEGEFIEGDAIAFYFRGKFRDLWNFHYDEDSGAFIVKNVNGTLQAVHW